MTQPKTKIKRIIYVESNVCVCVSTVQRLLTQSTRDVVLLLTQDLTDAGRSRYKFIIFLIRVQHLLMVMREQQRFWNLKTMWESTAEGLLCFPTLWS